MSDTIKIPIGGLYVEQNGLKWHIKVSGGDFSVRLVDGPTSYLSNLAVTMPAGNMVTVVAGILQE
jgi:hypothetical protein